LGVYLARKRESCWDGVEGRGIFGGMIALMREGGNLASTWAWGALSGLQGKC